MHYARNANVRSIINIVSIINIDRKICIYKSIVNTTLGRDYARNKFKNINNIGICS